MKIRSTESGQAIVVLVLVMVGLLGFAAMAVDGGVIFTERRRAQTAADSAAIAAALAGVNAQNYQQAAFNQALENGFNNDGVQNTVEIYNPPITGPYAPPYTESNLYYQVIITSVSEAVFSQFIFPDELKNTVEAVARAVPYQNISFGNAIHATSPDACKAVWFSGDNVTSVTGGHVFSNSIADGSYGGTACISGVQSGNSGLVDVNGAGIRVAGAWIQHSVSTVEADAGIVTGVEQQPLPPVPVPDCTGLPTQNDSGDLLEPGYYPGGIRITNQDKVMNPGLYCLDGEFRSTGGSLTGDGVTIYMISGDFHLAGNTTIDLAAPDNLSDASGNQWAGMLLYMNPASTSEIHLSGNSGSSYVGTIFAPDPANPVTKTKCTITGNADNFAIHSQLICYSLEFEGTSDIDITFDSGENYHMPPLIELVQ